MYLQFTDDNRTVSRTYQVFLYFKNKKKNNPIQKQANNFYKHFPKMIYKCPINT